MKRKIQLIDIDYQVEDGKVYLRGFGKTDSGENLLFYDRDFKPYFYAIPQEEIDALEEKVEGSEFSDDDGERLPIIETEVIERKDVEEELDVLKVTTTIPANVPKLKNELWDLPEVEECREFDIPFYKRYLIDKGIRPASWIEIEGDEVEEEDLDIGIEVEEVRTDVEQGEEPEREMMAFDLEVYEDEIIMASMKSEGFEKLLTTEDIDRDFVEVVEDEEDLLERFIEVITDKDVDILTGYNTDEFDFDVLRDRVEEHNLTLSLGRDGERMKFNRRGRFSGARLKGRMHLDLYPFISHVLSPGLESETLDLGSVAEEMLGENKDDMDWEDMKRSWSEKKDLGKFADYALKDSELALKLAEEIVPQILELSRLTGLIPFDACRLTYGQLTENFLLREAYERNMVSPNRPSRDSRKDRRRQGAYSGGFVYTPDAGLYKDIALFDFKSLYPTVMVAHNISPDTLNRDECEERFSLEEFDYDFCLDDQGFFPELVEKLVRDRARIKQEMNGAEQGTPEYNALDNRQSAEKILANSFYGYLGYEGARWYSRECAEATTYMGRKYIQDSIELAEEEGYEVVYGDTDSIFLMKENIKEDMDDFLDKVNDQLPRFMELEFEGFFTRGFFTSTDSGEGAKKKYALLSEDGLMKITGFEQVRRDWSPVAKETQKEVLRYVLGDDVEKAAEAVKETIKDLKEGRVPVEDLRIYTTLTKKPENYGSTAPHVEAAKKAMRRGDEIMPGTTIAYVITRGGGTISDRAEVLEYADSYDSDYYIENQVIPATLRVLKVFGYTEGQLKGKGKQSGLGQFG
ncbi:MAG: DNA-directed DNA polymerase [Candidatus Nanohaloarchaea archaeon]